MEFIPTFYGHCVRACPALIATTVLRVDDLCDFPTNSVLLQELYDGGQFPH